ncbi:mevalonate kinase [Kistimonas scapharcae]|uniref:Mevalonate kinase n=1 Tax=Kistimonas scapharcae TaxID=1036133 RepID=A0ABP8VAN4_9GAMM
MPDSVINTGQVVHVSVPGSIMLLGEHSVLYSQPAVACAVDRYMRVQVELLTSRDIVVESALGPYCSHLDNLQESISHRFLVEILRRWRETLACGLKISIASEFSHTVGLGSSAAVTVALVSALRAVCGLPLDQQEILRSSVEVVRAVQGRGSGTDLAASVYGGVIAFDADTLQVRRLSSELPIDLYYAGYKTPTTDVLARVAEESVRVPGVVDALYRLMGDVSREAITAIKADDLSQLGRCMNVYQGLMDALNVNDAVLSAIVYGLRALPGVMGAKISGSGLGDCVCALGDAGAGLSGFERIPVSVSPVGVSVDVFPR